jgi:hypothetical protein
VRERERERERERRLGDGEERRDGASLSYSSVLLLSECLSSLNFVKPLMRNTFHWTVGNCRTEPEVFTA